MCFKKEIGKPKACHIIFKTNFISYETYLFLWVGIYIHIYLLARNLKKAESRMDKLKRALDEVDAKVASLRNRFETLTKEAAELKIRLDKENETIQAAETLVTKLEGEYQRWSRQVNRKFMDRQLICPCFYMCVVKY
jgi:uncharacterized protein YoxC